ncbi:MAG: diguanylate cyclase [Woeseiaceae bacterium]
MEKDAQHWKDEYRELVKEHEQYQAESDTMQQELRQILRLMLTACRGWRQNIDEELEVLQIRLDKAKDSLTLLNLRGVANEIIVLLQAHRKESESTTTVAVNRLVHVRDDFVASVSAYPRLRKPIETIANNEETDIADQFSKFAGVVVEICRKLDQERKETEEFLSEVKASVQNLEQWASNATSAADNQRAASSELEQQVSEDVDSLNTTLTEENDAGQLKAKLKSRLDRIGSHIATYREKEEARIHEMEQRNAALNSELTMLKDRTVALDAELKEQKSLLLLDSLTKVHSRFAYEQRLAETLDGFNRDGLPFCYSLWDIDHFKAINDNMGHQAGDALLKQIADYLKRYVRSTDFVARIGGEEFVILLPNSKVDTAIVIADKLRALIDSAKFQFNDKKVPISISCGITEVIQGDTVEQLYERADKALYSAKNAGRNRCIAA